MSHPIPFGDMNMLKLVFLAVAVLVVVFLIVVAMQPTKFRVVRSGTIDAPPDKVFDHVNNFHAWNAWSPWAKLDPNNQVTYEGPQAGPGAIYKWSGNAKAGQGQMTLLESQAAKMVKIRLEFLKPFAATNETIFHFEPQGEKTLVTWSMTGNNNFMAKAFNLVMNMDKLVGGDFEKGLASMKTAVETA